MTNLITLDTASRMPLYLQLYHYFKSAIEERRLPAGEKLPSIRSLAKNLSISKITVEKAYLQLLSEGYIENANRSRYTVNQLAVSAASTAPWPSLRPGFALRPPSLPRYDFSSGAMDIDGFDFSLWKRYISKAFQEKQRLLGYGNIRGEEELRQEIVKYIHQSRGVAAHVSQIIIGAGVQHLLGILCSILKRDHSSIAFEEPGFRNGRRIFADNAFRIRPVSMRTDGIDMADLSASGEKLVYVSPSHQFPTGYVMPIGRRRQLLNWAQQCGGLIIEDDYDSEFRYYGRPIPALKGLDTSGSVVYLGSFSKIIPPSIRLSYMVLPDTLAAIYQEQAFLYNQAASTIEQLALARFMADGHLERQIRRLRKLYQEKRRLFFDTIKSTFGDKVIIHENDSGLHTILTVNSPLPAKQLVERALQSGCRVASIDDYYWDITEQKLPQIILYFSKIPSAELAPALQLLKTAWFG